MLKLLLINSLIMCTVIHQANCAPPSLLNDNVISAADVEKIDTIPYNNDVNIIDVDELPTTTEQIPPLPPRPTHPMDNENWLPPTGPQHEKSREYWQGTGQEILQKQLGKTKLNENVAKNILIFIGDGMSLATQMATRVYMGGEEKELSFEKFPYTGLTKTYCINYQVSDSTCTATAFLSGIKGNYGVMGMSGHVPLNNCMASLDKSQHIDSIFKWAQDAGMSTGVVTNTRITHATPAAAYAKSAARYFENDGATPSACEDIAKQLVHGEVGKRLQVALGGGAREFLPNTYVDARGSRGRRTDGRNLINEWIVSKRDVGNAVFVNDKQGLMQVNVANTDYLFGLFNGDHMDYNLLADHAIEPTLTEMTKIAIEILKKNPKGYLILVEGGRIDHAHHRTLARLAIDETLEFHKTVETVSGLVDLDDTLVLVTSDHSHTMTVGGYPPRGTDIFGKGDFSRIDEMPLFTLAYANGEGFEDHFYDDGGRRNPLGMDFSDTSFRYPTAVPLEDETHGGDDVGVYTDGPWAHIFTGLYEQHYIAHGLMYASCLGPPEYDRPSICDGYRRGNGVQLKPSSLYLLITFIIPLFVRYFAQSQSL